MKSMECIKPQHEKQIQRQNTPLRQITLATMNMIRNLEGKGFQYKTKKYLNLTPLCGSWGQKKMNKESLINTNFVWERIDGSSSFTGTPEHWK